MKRLLLVILIVCLAVPAWSQVSMVAYGSMMKKGAESQTGFFAGMNNVVMFDSTKNMTVYNRTGYFYVNGADSTKEIQSISTFMLTEKSFGLGDLDIFVAIGGGMLYQIQEGDDEVGATTKIEVGVDVYRKLTIAFGADYIPIKGEADEIFVYAIIDIFPF